MLTNFDHKVSSPFPQSGSKSNSTLAGGTQHTDLRGNLSFLALYHFWVSSQHVYQPFLRQFKESSERPCFHQQPMASLLLLYHQDIGRQHSCQVPRWTSLRYPWSLSRCLRWPRSSVSWLTDRSKSRPTGRFTRRGIRRGWNTILYVEGDEKCM